jgi:hypothetical protein
MRTVSKVVLAAVAAFFYSAALAQFCPQDFDGVSAPALPAGWTSVADGVGSGWMTDISDAESPPNAAFAVDESAVGNSYLYSPVAVVSAANSSFTFRHDYSLENTFDGGVLEVSIDGGSFVDVVAAGGTFVAGGYNNTISTMFMSPIAGRPAWTGASGGYGSTIVHLPPAAFGRSTVLRWRMASDQSVGFIGWHVDSIVCGQQGRADSVWRIGDVPYPIPIMDQATTVMGGVLYSFGGVSGGLNTGQSYKYDGTQWTPIGPLPATLEQPVAVNDGTHVFILGGNVAGADVDTVYRYTPQTNTFETMAPMPTAAWALAATVVGGKIVKFGGEAGGLPTAATEIYDIATNTWSIAAPYPTALGFVSAFTRNGYVYGAGGIGASDASNKTYRYDPATGVWDDAPIPDLPEGRWGAAIIQTVGGAVLAGGYVGNPPGAGAISATAVGWDANGNAWHAFPALATGRARMTGGLLAGRPLVIGGRSTTSLSFDGTGDVQVFDRLFADGFELPE